MNDEKTGGYAFPDSAAPRKYADCESYSMGMTMLDHFAGLAMQAIIAKLPLELTNTGDDKFGLTAAGAYAYAAAMIAERNRLMNEKP